MSQYLNKYDCGSPQDVLSVPIRGPVQITRDVRNQPREEYVDDRTKFTYRPRTYKGPSSLPFGQRPVDSRSDRYETLC